MIYSELKSLLTKNKRKVKEAAELAGYAENSVKVAFEDGTMSFSKVPLLCQLAGISPNEFYGWGRDGNGNSDYDSTILGVNAQNSDQAILALREELNAQRAIIKEKDKQINRLLAIIEKVKKP